jgi:hypothetical protein
VLILPALGALGASLALATAYLRWPVVADVLAVAAAGCAMLAFLAALAATVRAARRPGPGRARP